MPKSSFDRKQAAAAVKVDGVLLPILLADQGALYIELETREDDVRQAIAEDDDAAVAKVSHEDAMAQLDALIDKLTQAPRRKTSIGYKGA
jgi:hypothetical protein